MHNDAGRRLKIGLSALALGVAFSAPAAAADVSSARLPWSGHSDGSTAHQSGRDHPGRTLLRDDFRNANRGGWTIYNRVGAIRDGRLLIDGGYTGAATGRDGWALTHTGDRHWTDYEYEVNYNNDLGGAPPDIRQVDVYFHVTTPLPAPDTQQLATLYRLEIWDPGTPSPKAATACAPGLSQPLPNGLVDVLKYVDGEVTLLAEACTSNSHNGTNSVRVRVQGGKIHVLVNGRSVLQAVDPDPIKYGGVGVGKIWETNGWFDDVTVRELRPRPRGCATPHRVSSS